jgi:hypothetical protein
LQVEGLVVSIDSDFGHFDVRAITRRELDRHAMHAKTMLIAASAASLAIVAASALFVGFWL